MEGLVGIWIVNNCQENPLAKLSTQDKDRLKKVMGPTSLNTSKACKLKLENGSWFQIQLEMIMKPTTKPVNSRIS